jgi:hypothetical protein
MAILLLEISMPYVYAGLGVLGVCMVLLFVFLGAADARKQNARLAGKQDASLSAMGRKELVDEMCRAYPSVKVKRHGNPRVPVSLIYNGKTFAMLYAGDENVVLTVCIADAYAEELLLTHPDVRRSSFPSRPNWYDVNESYTFTGREDILKILYSAILFAGEQHPSAKRLISDEEASAPEENAPDTL